MIEVTLVLPFFLLMVFATLDISWGVFVKAVLEHSLRVGVRYGITNHVTNLGPPVDPANPFLPNLCPTAGSLHDCIAQHMNWAAGGNGTTGGFLDGAQVVGPGDPGCTQPKCIVIDYVGQDGNAAAGRLNSGGNVLRVSLSGNGGSPTGFPIPVLIPLPFFGPTPQGSAVDWTTYVRMYSADTLSQVISYPAP